MKLKSKIVLIFAFIFLVSPIKAIPQDLDMNLQKIVPENLAIIKNQYSSIVIAFFMEQCINNLYNAFMRNRIHPVFAKKSSFQICGCGMDIMRKDMPEKDYLDMLYNRTQMAQAMMDSNLKVCGNMYGKFYTESLKKDNQT